MSLHPFPRRVAALLSLALLLAPAAVAAEAIEPAGAEAPLSRMSLEELAELEVTSVSRWPQRLAAAANAVFVITQEDIRRSGVTTLVELLRLVPGVHVAQIEANKWAVGVRGFTNRLSRATLVLIDGRSVYSPLFAGTYWEVQDILLADVDRIEVIRGPGGTLWGANAVNGVINILTKPASATQGWIGGFRAGTDRHTVGLRYGAQPGERTFWRAYAKAYRRDAADPAVPPPFDDADAAQAGFRADLGLDDRHHVTVQGDTYRGDLGTRVTRARFDPPSAVSVDGESRVSGGNLLARMTRDGERSQTTLQAWVDRTRRLDLNLAEWRTTADLEVDHHVRELPLGQELIAGLGYRVTRDRTEGNPLLFLERPSRRGSLYSAFFQDEIPLRRGVRLSGGVKVEHNAYTGFEWQPSVRGSWEIRERRLLWASVSRAIRSPSRIELDLAGTGFVSDDPPTFLRLSGNEDFKSERLLAYEVGWRSSGGRLHWDLSLFHNVYDRLLSLEPLPPFSEDVPPPPHLVLPVTFGNGHEGRGRGGELSASWQPTPHVHVAGAWSFLDLDLRATAESGDTNTASQEGASPRRQALLRATFELPRALEVDAALRWVDRLTVDAVPSYAELDAQLAWVPSARIRVALIGRNLLHARHAEFGPAATRVEIPRAVYGSMAWTW
jgi:iron complex outermembrane receptor protein